MEKMGDAAKYAGPSGVIATALTILLLKWERFELTPEEAAVFASAILVLVNLVYAGLKPLLSQNKKKK